MDCDTPSPGAAETGVSQSILVAVACGPSEERAKALAVARALHRGNPARYGVSHI